MARAPSQLLGVLDSHLASSVPSPPLHSLRIQLLMQMLFSRSVECRLIEAPLLLSPRCGCSFVWVFFSFLSSPCLDDTPVFQPLRVCCSCATHSPLVSLSFSTASTVVLSFPFPFRLFLPPLCAPFFRPVPIIVLYSFNLFFVFMCLSVYTKNKSIFLFFFLTTYTQTHTHTLLLFPIDLRIVKLSTQVGKKKEPHIADTRSNIYF